MRRVYNINRSLRGHAVREHLQELWLSKVDAPAPTPIMPVRSTHNRWNRHWRDFDLLTNQSYKSEFRGIGSPDYIAIEVCENVDGVDRPRNVNHFRDQAAFFVDCARGKALFKSLRRIDLIVTVARPQRLAAEPYAEDMVRCIHKQWKRFGVEDGLVRVFWEP